MADPAIQTHPHDQAQDQQARRGHPATPMITATASRRHVPAMDGDAFLTHPTAP
jgi:hypothetical protein